MRAGQLENVAVGNTFLIHRCVWEPRTGLHKQQEACVSIHRKSVMWGDWGCSSHDKDLGSEKQNMVGCHEILVHIVGTWS